jgi:DNA-binding response OmpR family regulator
MDGIEIMQQAADISPDTQIVMLTAHGSMESAIEALRYGAHDYLIKPSSPQEILSSVAGALARHAEAQRKRLLLGQMETSLQQLKDAEGVMQSTVAGQRVISLPDGVMVDLARREIWRGNERVTLTPTEGKLLRVLLENKGRVMTHRDLVFLVQGYEITDWEAPEVLRPLVSRLRRKLSAFPDGDKWIANVRGTGYVFDAVESA